MPVDFHHSRRNAHVDLFPNLGVGHRVVIPRPRDVPVACDPAPIDPFADLILSRWQGTQEGMFLGLEDTRPRPGAFLKRLSVIRRDLSSDGLRSEEHTS